MIPSRRRGSCRCLLTRHRRSEPALSGATSERPAPTSYSIWRSLPTPPTEWSSPLPDPLPDSLAEGRVLSEPCSGSNSLITGKMQGISLIARASIRGNSGPLRVCRAFRVVKALRTGRYQGNVSASAPSHFAKFRLHSCLSLDRPAIDPRGRNSSGSRTVTGANRRAAPPRALTAGRCRKRANVAFPGG
jgi:hypothetical protein